MAPKMTLKSFTRANLNLIFGVSLTPSISSYSYSRLARPIPQLIETMSPSSILISLQISTAHRLAALAWEPSPPTVPSTTPRSLVSRLLRYREWLTPAELRLHQPILLTKYGLRLDHTQDADGHAE